MAENEAMEEEFKLIVRELNEKRQYRNDGFYERILDEDYGTLQEELDKIKTKELIAKKGEHLKNKIRHSISMAYDLGQMTKNEQNLVKKQSTVNPDLVTSVKFKKDGTIKNISHLPLNVGLADKDPLAFIDSVLRHHGQI